MVKSYSMKIASEINNFLLKNDWKFFFDEERGIFRFDLRLKNKMKTINYVIYIENEYYLVYAIAPIGANSDDYDMMTRMAEFICQANYGLTSGNFEFDMSDGEIRYKSYVNCDGIIPTQEMIKESIHCPAAMFERYVPGILDIIFCNSTATDAVNRCEKLIEEGIIEILKKELEDSEYVDKLFAQLRTCLDTDEDDEEIIIEAEDNEDMDKIKMNLFTSEGDTI